MNMIRMTAIFISVFFVMPAFAEFYQYKDANGVLHVTDNFSDVPDNAPLDIESVYEIPLENPSPDPGSQRTESADDNPPPPAESTWEGELQINAESLKNERASLKQKYEALQLEKQELGEQPLASASHADKRAYQSRVEALNRKIIDYDELQKQFEKKVGDFNSKILAR